MATLTIDENKAREIYPTAPDSLKAILEQTFGGKQFFEQKITDRIKNFNHVMSIMGGGYDFVSGSDDEIAYRKLKLIAECLNEGWKPNWDNSNEYKYYPWFYMDSVRGFGLGGVSCYFSSSNVGSRLCFKSEALAEFAAKTFKDIYKQYMLIA